MSKDHPVFLAIYFGCTMRGHFAHLPQSREILYCTQTQIPGFPWTNKDLDGGLLENGKIPDEPNGNVYWTCGGRPDLWFAFYWWDRSGDKRGASNSGFYVRGFQLGEEQKAFEYACEQWPDIVSRQIHPLHLMVVSPGAPQGDKAA